MLYRVPPDLDDPDELWDFVRVAFRIKLGELPLEGAVMKAPEMTRKAIKKIHSGQRMAAAQELPVIGKYLLQRNVMRTAIPGVVIPLAAVVGHSTTKLAGWHARSVFGQRAKVLELAERLISRTQHLELMLWVAWLVIEPIRR